MVVAGGTVSFVSEYGLAVAPRAVGKPTVVHIGIELQFTEVLVDREEMQIARQQLFLTRCRGVMRHAIAIGRIDVSGIHTVETENRAGYSQCRKQNTG